MGCFPRGGLRVVLRESGLWQAITRIDELAAAQSQARTQDKLPFLLNLFADDTINVLELPEVGLDRSLHSVLLPVAAAMAASPSGLVNPVEVSSILSGMQFPWD